MSEKWFVFLFVWCAAVVGTAGEFSVNVRTTSNQCNPSVAVYQNGGFIVVWSSYYSSSGRSNDIIARRFDPMGEPVADEFRVNSERDGNQTYPMVTADSEGHTLVAWQGPGAAGDEDIVARILDVNGVALTDDIVVNAIAEGRQLNPSVACSQSGTFLVVWEDEQVSGSDKRSGVSGRLLDTAGHFQDAQFSIDPGDWDCRYPDVAMTTSGDFAVVWLRDRSNKSVITRLFDPNGEPETEPLEVNVQDISSITSPSIAISASDDFVVVWDGDPNRASDDHVFARLFDPNGSPATEPFMVDSGNPGPHQWPQAAIDNSGRFVVVWQAESDDADRATDIYARRFDPTGRPMEEPFLLGDTGLEKQRYPDVATSPAGPFIALWESNQQPGSDYDIYGQVQSALLTTDFTSDGVVDFLDFQVLGWSWRMPGQTDVASYEVKDLRAFCDEWLK